MNTGPGVCVRSFWDVPRIWRLLWKYSYLPELVCICYAVHGVAQRLSVEIEGKDLVVKKYFILNCSCSQ